MTLPPRPIVRILTTLAALVCMAVEAATPQPVEELQQFAAAFLTEHLHASHAGNSTPIVTAGALDPRLRLQHCTSTLHGILPATGQVAARMTVGVRCATPAWTVYVPMTVETELAVLVMRTAAARLSSPADADVELRRQRLPGIATLYITSKEQLRGRHLRVAVGSGTALRADHFAPDILIKRGQRVTLVVEAGGIEVRAVGEAVADANASGRVRVLNLSSRRIVEGQAESTDRVRVGL